MEWINDKFWNDFEGSGRRLIEDLYRHLPGASEKTTKTSVKIPEKSCPRLEGRTYRIRVQEPYRYTSMLSARCYNPDVHNMKLCPREDLYSHIRGKVVLVSSV
jgi:hypothetical protein